MVVKKNVFVNITEPSFVIFFVLVGGAALLTAKKIFLHSDCKPRNNFA